MMSVSTTSGASSGQRHPRWRDRYDESLIDAFEYYLRRQGRAEGTKVKYLHVVRGFDDWVGERELTTLTPADVDLFLRECEAAFEQVRGRPLSRATVRGKIAALRSFFDYLERMGLLVDERGAVVRNPMRAVIAPPVEQRANDFLSADEDAALLSVECSEHERIIVWLLRWTGLRVSEACSLTLGDFDLAPLSNSSCPNQQDVLRPQKHPAPSCARARDTRVAPNPRGPRIERPHNTVPWHSMGYGNETALCVASRQARRRPRGRAGCPVLVLVRARDPPRARLPTDLERRELL